MNKISVDLADGRNFVISSQEGITVTLPSLSTFKVISDADIEKAFNNYMKLADGGAEARDVFFAGAKFIMNGE